MSRQNTQYDLRFLLRLTVWAAMCTIPMRYHEDGFVFFAFVFPLGLFFLLGPLVRHPARYECHINRLRDGYYEIAIAGGEASTALSISRLLSVCVLSTFVLTFGFAGIKDSEPVGIAIAISAGMLCLIIATCSRKTFVDATGRSVCFDFHLLGTRCLRRRHRIRETDKLAVSIYAAHDTDGPNSLRYQHTIEVVRKWTRLPIIACFSESPNRIKGMSKLSRQLAAMLEIPDTTYSRRRNWLYR